MRRYVVPVCVCAAALGLAASWSSARAAQPASRSCEGISGYYGNGTGLVLAPDRTSLHVTMPYGRPNAYGVCRDGNIGVNFPDDGPVSGRFDGTTIRWSNATTWTRTEDAQDIGPQEPSGSPGLCNGLSGIYNDGIVLVVGGPARDVHVSMGGGRPEAYGRCNRRGLTVTFPDDRTFTGRFDGRQIRWSNGTVWARR